MPSAPLAARALRLCRGRATLVFLLTLGLGADAAAAEKRRAFATSTAWTGDISNWPGAAGATVLDRADSVCRTLAANATPPLPNADTYRAWLSTSTTDAYCHVQGLNGTRANSCDGAFEPGAGPWYLFNGATPYTGTLDELVNDGVIYRGVLRDESGVEIPGISDERRYWTGTVPSGLASSFTCEDWTSSDDEEFGVAGDAHGGAIDWSWAINSPCNEIRRLLCLEPGPSDEDPPSWSPGALVFLTGESGNGELSTWPSAGGFFGVTAAHEVCQTSARGSHLPEPASFVPWLSTPTVDAIDRVTVDGPFRRIDGVSVAGNRAALADGGLAAGIYVFPDGAYLELPGPRTVWTGTFADGTANVNDCGLWSEGVNGFGLTGTAGIGAAADWTEGTAFACSHTYRLYCISNVVTLFWDGFELTADTGRWSGAVP